MPNSDPEGKILIQMIEEYVKLHPNAKVFTSLGQLLYLSCIKHFDGVVGNSSSGLIEVPYFKKGTINIGNRQKGRLCAESVIDCDPNNRSITKAINKLYSNDFQSKLPKVKNPYGTGGASKLIVSKIENFVKKNLVKKKFYDL